MSIAHRIERIIPATLQSGLLIAVSSLSAQETIMVFPPDVSSFPEVSTWFFPFDSDVNVALVAVETLFCDGGAVQLELATRSGEGAPRVVIDELSISVRFDPTVMLPIIDDDGIFVGTPLVGWRVDRLDRLQGEVTWHLRGDPVRFDRASC